MQPGRARGFSLWLMPEGAVRDGLAALVVRLAARLGTEPFAPHLTLLPGVSGPERDVLRAAAALASRLPPLSLRLVAVAGLPEHFRCLFARAEATAPLLAAHAAAARAFGREPDPAFLPHVSLVYGTLPPATKRGLAGELAGEATVPFAAGRLHVWRTGGPVADWREAGAFPLEGGSRP